MLYLSTSYICASAFVTDAVLKELKRIVEDSHIMAYVVPLVVCVLCVCGVSDWMVTSVVLWCTVRMTPTGPSPIVLVSRSSRLSSAMSISLSVYVDVSS